MGRRFRGIVGAVKDTASLSKASLLSSSSDAQMAVLRATTHHLEPSDPRHLAALLAFGHGSRVAAAACISALAARLHSTRDPAVAIKSLLALHHLLARGAFILRDQLPAALLRHPASGRNPLALPASAFPSADFPLASWSRWLARLLELLLLAAATTATFPPSHHHRVVDPASSNDRLASLLNRDLLIELDALVAVVEEVARAPAASAAAVKGKKLISEAVRVAEEYMVTAEPEILVRVRELGERIGSLGFADSVELVCLLRRLEECKDRADRPSDGRWTDDDWFWVEVRELKEQAEKVVVRKEEEGRWRVRREKLGSSSARLMDRVASGPIVPVRFSSSRWVDR
ncbi:putative clathrin assembly protein At4g40080 [Phoenix dactylifera]|uniref:Clathrin assembly protein At4g40080 n=1 Tax=Phoenix dactylifera TaxID=42345 RepID=A0A8B7BEW2_PHODC|nr:putative clathrin assembly protein At4g40080 [Phoenix dactylifera]